MLKPGIYEQLINLAIQKELSDLSEAEKNIVKIDEAEASTVLAQYCSDIIRSNLEQLSDQDTTAKIQVINKIIALLSSEGEDISPLSVGTEGEQLLAVLSATHSENPLLKLGMKSAKDLLRPESPISQSSLFTGSQNEPSLFSELKKEIASADRIDFLVSFIKMSGLNLIRDTLKEFTENGGKLRIITTSYMGASDAKAIEQLCNLSNTEIRISYDIERQRLHAKSYIFYRESGFTTAYIGSSNLSSAALNSGLEWNVKLTAKDMPFILKKMETIFDSYWNNASFISYTNSEEDKKKLKDALQIGKTGQSSFSDDSFLFDLNPYPHQLEILDQIDAEREVRGNYKNLIVSATGTGKTLISAFDYKRFSKKHGARKPRLLFVVHREEILKQSLAVFRHVLKDSNFGALFVGQFTPDSLDHLFISIQTFSSKNFTEAVPPNYYDYIIVDEFHHAAAPSYQALLSYFQPKILLGLTATPERMDGRDILKYFNHKITAEIRLPEAINRGLLCPFQYFGISDEIDLSNVHWLRGGYDKAELSNIFSLQSSSAEKRANHIINSINRYVNDIHAVHGLGFCVSVEHAKFMESHFQKNGISCLSLTGNSSVEERNTAKSRLISGEIQFIFVVDLYNEGIDIPEVDTILFLRPTESLTVFLQQLGRGLRLSTGKECLTVLDFIGQANKKYNFEEKFSALLSHHRNNLSQEIQKGFTALPQNCYIQLEKVASKIILENIRANFDRKDGFLFRLKSFSEDTGLPLSYDNFLKHFHLSPKDIYLRKISFSRLCVEAEQWANFSEPLEELITKALPKLCSINSRRWIHFLQEFLSMFLEKTSEDCFDYLLSLPKLQARFFRMFYFSLFQRLIDWESPEDKENLINLQKSPTMLRELLDLLSYNLDNIDFVDQSLTFLPDCPLDVHCSYSRDQILLALDFEKPNTVREGVKWLPEKKLDLLFVTLNKSDKEYSPSTMYQDYSLNERLFHWQSQNATSDTSETGKRYIQHKTLGTNVFLFVREWKKTALGAEAYTFLGSARYVSHTGSKPMSIIWQLETPIPEKYLKQTGKVLIG